MTITKQFVELFGGSIGIKSNVGEGSLFRVELPVDTVEAEEAVNQTQLLPGEVIGLAAGQPSYRILIVEDQLENQLLLKRLMTDLGLETRLAENGEECVQIFKQWQPDLIWMDRRMPVMNGEEAARRVRQLPGGDKVKIVAVTASAFKEEREQMIASGIDEVVRKPFRFDEIYDSMTRFLGAKFNYRGDISRSNATPGRLTPQRLRGISPANRGELRAALESLDRWRIDNAINRISEEDADLGEILIQLVEEFDYPHILWALEEVDGE
jgi:CheY-like chemotaxis protein